MTLPSNFRKLSLEKRRELIQDLFSLPSSIDSLEFPERVLETVDSMIENAGGIFSVPLGFIPAVIINGRPYTIPMATEEPSVIGAASYASVLVNQAGGVSAAGARSLMTEQIFLVNCTSDTQRCIDDLKEEIFNRSHILLKSMEKRGGGLEMIQTSMVDESLIKVELVVHVCDAMGANLLNTLGESLGPWLAEETGTELLMAILSNSGEHRISAAEFSLPSHALARGGQPGEVIARKIVQASRAAELDPWRAVTHNKGIMNGIGALLLATGNDTRAVESAVHFHACSSGIYKGLSRYSLENDCLVGRIEIPVPAALVGGSVRFHPTALNNLKILGVASASELAGVAAAVGLLQNFAALFALVSEGIQKGHMRMHARKRKSR